MFDVIGKRRWFYAFSLLITIPGLIFILLTPFTDARPPVLDRLHRRHRAGRSGSRTRASRPTRSRRSSPSTASRPPRSDRAPASSRSGPSTPSACSRRRRGDPGPDPGPAVRVAIRVARGIGPPSASAGASAAPSASPSAAPVARARRRRRPPVRRPARPEPVAVGVAVRGTGRHGRAADRRDRSARSAPRSRTSSGPIAEQTSLTTIGAVVSSDLISQALILILVGSLGILLWITYRFRDVKFGVTALVALLHDVIVVVGLLRPARARSSASRSTPCS